MQPLSSTHEKLFQPLTPETFADKNKQDNCYIAIPDVESYEQLTSHWQFYEIQQQFLDDILTLKNLVPSYINHTYDSKIENFYNKIKYSCDSKNAVLFNIYQTTRYEIHQLIAELSKPQTGASYDYLCILLHECLYGLDHCFDAIATRFKISFLNLKTVKAGLRGFIYNIRAELAHEFIRSFIFDQQKKDPNYINKSMEIHYFNAFNNLLSDMAQIEKISDSYEPKDISNTLTENFLKKAKLQVNDFAIVQKIAQYWINKLSDILADLKLKHWETSLIPVEELTWKRTERIDKNVFQPMNALHETMMKKEAIGFYTIANELNDDCYSFNEYQHRIHAWIAERFCKKAHVLTKISINGHTNQCIGSMDNLFFWVFKDENTLSQKKLCQFEQHNCTPLNLSHLTTMDFTTWEEQHFLPLLLQAVTQTKNADDYLVFFSNPWVLAQLNGFSTQALTLFFNPIIEKYAHQQKY